MTDLTRKRELVAKIIFSRMAGQLSSFNIRDSHWTIAYQGWIENPALFPAVETCMDIADEILRRLEADDFDK